MAKNNWGNPIFDTVWQFFATFSLRQLLFLTFPACFSQSEYFFPIWITIVLIASTLINHYDRSNFLDMRHLQEQVKKAFCYQQLFWPFTVWINCSSDLKKISNSRPSASNFKTFSRSLEQFFLTVGRNNFGNKIPFTIPQIRSCQIWSTLQFRV